MRSENRKYRQMVYVSGENGATGKAGNGKRDGNGNGNENDTSGLLYCLFHFASNHQTEASDSVVYRTGIFGPAGSRYIANGTLLL